MRIVSIGGSPTAAVGKAEETVDRVVNRLNPYGLHFAFLDPYNLLKSDEFSSVFLRPLSFGDGRRPIAL
jgi:hypothetical protein